MNANDSATEGALILLHPEDNVLVATRSLAAGAGITLDGRPVTLKQALAVGHKVARRDLDKGEKILKYGAPIGSMLEPVAAGDWVHMHNLTSDYLASHTRRREDRSPTTTQQEPHS